MSCCVQAMAHDVCSICTNAKLTYAREWQGLLGISWEPPGSLLWPSHWSEGHPNVSAFCTDLRMSVVGPACLEKKKCPKFWATSDKL